MSDTQNAFNMTASRNETFSGVGLGRICGEHFWTNISNILNKLPLLVLHNIIIIIIDVFMYYHKVSVYVIIILQFLLVKEPSRNCKHRSSIMGFTRLRGDRLYNDTITFSLITIIYSVVSLIVLADHVVNLYRYTQWSVSIIFKKSSDKNTRTILFLNSIF